MDIYESEGGGGLDTIFGEQWAVMVRNSAGVGFNKSPVQGSSTEQAWQRQEAKISKTLERKLVKDVSKEAEQLQRHE